MTGRVPDENYAREVMQLFSIGLYQLNADGSVQTGPTASRSRPTRQRRHCPACPRCSPAGAGTPPNSPIAHARLLRRQPTPSATGPRMAARRSRYSQVPLITAKRGFSAVDRAAEQRPTPTATPKIALDTLFNHPNVGPFIGKQLIQRLVTQQPEPGLRRARGGGVRQQRQRRARRHEGGRARRSCSTPRRAPSSAATTRFGKLREPVLRLHSFLRAFNARPTAGSFTASATPTTRPRTSARRRCARRRCSTSSARATCRRARRPRRPAWSCPRCS